MNYLKISWRVLAKQRLYSLLNTGGLVIGLTTSMLLALWVANETGYDRFHIHHKNIVKVMLSITSASQETQVYGSVPAPVADAMNREIPGVVLASCSWEEKSLFHYHEFTSEENGIVADSAFLQIFGFKLLKGDRQTVLNDPASLVISEKLAEKYFGHADPIGRIIRLDQTRDYRVVGILANVPGNSSLQFDYLRPLPRPAAGESWVDVRANVFAMVAPGFNNSQLHTQLKAMAKRHLPEHLTGWTFFPHNLDDLYLRSNFKNGVHISGGRIVYVQLFSIVALFVLLIAIVNFISMSTARASGRAKEVAVRKAVGAGKWTLIRQFMGESMLLTLSAGLVALGLLVLLLPVLNELLEKQIVICWTSPFYWLAYAGVLLACGMLAGLYPAFVLSSFRPIRVLNGLTDHAKDGAAGLRKLLVITQFTTVSILLVCTGIVYQQISFIQHKKLGYGQHNLIRFEARGLNTAAAYVYAKNSFAGVQGIAAVSGASSSMQGTFGRNYVEWAGKDGPERTMFTVISGDHDLLTTLHIPMAGGRNFSGQFGKDSAGVILNETAAQRMKLIAPLGEQIRVNNKVYQVIGITKDFHITSVHQPIEPTVILYNQPEIKYFFIRLAAGNQAGALEKLNETYQTLRPGFPLNFQFIDQQQHKLYKSELQIGILANCFSVVAIVISCLGLFGLSSFSIQQRKKEIAIRKILGASLVSLFSMVTKDFVLLVFISLLVAAYPSWYLMNEWLGTFAYRVEINAGLFVIIGILTIDLALLTVSWQTIRAALANPVDSLRND